MSEKAKGQWTTGEPGYLPGNSPVGRNWIVAVLDSGKSRVATAQAESREEVEKLSRLIAAAPSLYEACKAALKSLQQTRESGDAGFYDEQPEELLLKSALKSVEAQ
jgi:hypothetical protein